MDERTLTALKGSIAKWEGIVAGTMKDDGPDNCPLCEVFFDNPLWCDGCPVRGATGLPGCRGTPYDCYDSNHPSMSIAQAELDFLRSLLPDESHV